MAARTCCVLFATGLLCLPAAAGELPSDAVGLHPRWRAVQQIVQQAAEQSHFRWSMPGTISRRAFVGVPDAGPLKADSLLGDACRQTGLTREELGGIAVLHLPNEARRRELVGRASGSDERARLSAIADLGWLRDARAWPELARLAVGGDPEAATALAALLAQERTRKDRLVRKAAAETLKQIGPLSEGARSLAAEFEAEDKDFAPEYRPRNKRFDETFPENAEVRIKEFAPATYASIGETRVVVDWANRLMIRYGGCSGCYSNECFALDVGSGTWFPIRAASHFIGWDNERRTNPGCSRGMAYDGLTKVVWIGRGIGGGGNPGDYNYGENIGLSAYDAAADRFALVDKTPDLPKAWSGEPHKFYAFDYAGALVIGSMSSAEGVGVLDVRRRTASLRKGPTEMPRLDHYPPPAFAYDPVSRLVMCAHPKIDWRLALYSAEADTFRWSAARLPEPHDVHLLSGLVYDSLNREMILLGGVDKEHDRMQTYLYDRKANQWADLHARDPGNLGGRTGLTVFDPEHNVFLGIHGGGYRYRNVPVGTKAFYGAPASREAP